MEKQYSLNSARKLIGVTRISLERWLLKKMGPDGKTIKFKYKSVGDAHIYEIPESEVLRLAKFWKAKKE